MPCDSRVHRIAAQAGQSRHGSRRETRKERRAFFALRSAPSIHTANPPRSRRRSMACAAAMTGEGNEEQEQPQRNERRGYKDRPPLP